MMYFFICMTWCQAEKIAMRYQNVFGIYVKFICSDYDILWLDLSWNAIFIFKNLIDHDVVENSDANFYVERPKTN